MTTYPESEKAFAIYLSGPQGMVMQNLIFDVRIIKEIFLQGFEFGHMNGFMRGVVEGRNE